MKKALSLSFCELTTSRRFALLVALALLVLSVVLGELFVSIHQRETQARRNHETVTHAATVRARIERELNALLYLSSGLGGYLVVRKDNTQPTEVNDILAVLHRTSRHVRNFGVAIGERLVYVYPIEGNEKAIGMRYRDQPQQWPAIEKVIASGQPSLTGPVNLVQGGRGLIYRVPLLVDGQYWGLLSTVINVDSLLAGVFEKTDRVDFAYGLRTRVVAGSESQPIHGDTTLFSNEQAVIQDIDVPGGQWQIAMLSAQAGPSVAAMPLAIRTASVLLGSLIAWLIYLLLCNRAELTSLVMFDALTGLANRRLLEDRHKLVIARLQRHREQPCALLFLDLDGFKQINDIHGHKAGDVVLQAVARRLQAMVRTSDIVARWGGDEFVVLLEDIQPADLALLVERIRTNVAVPIRFESLELVVQSSIGVAHYPPEGGKLQDILKSADQQMYLDKTQRKQAQA